MFDYLDLLIAISLYLSATVFLYLSIDRQAQRWRRLAVGCTFAAAAVHCFAFWQQWVVPGEPNVSLPNLMSLCALVVVLLVSFSVFTRNNLFDAGLVALPLTILILLIDWLLPTQNITLNQLSTGTTVHILSSVLSFGFLSIASVYALFSTVIDHFLRSHQINALVRSLPPLVLLEQLLFRLIATGFILLTVSLASGLAFVDDLFGQHLVHKTMLSILAWLVFGLLVFGRLRYGWRGRKAVRLCLAGIALLLLAYFGSKMVLENILGRSWHL